MSIGIYASAGIYVFFISSFLGHRQAEKIGENNRGCANYNEKCSSLNPKPCCGDNLICRFRNSTGDFVCDAKVKLGSSCRSDENCLEIMHAKCYEKSKCVCRQNNVRVNEVTCMPLLGGFCWKDEKCATENSHCVENQCQCSKYYQQIGISCLPSMIQTYCSHNSECEAIKDSECSKNICSCPSNTILIRDICRPLLGITCIQHEDCKVNNSRCVDGFCQCRPDYVFRQFECVPKFLFEDCQSNRDCDQIEFAVCGYWKKCECDVNYVAVKNKTCKPLLGGICVHDYDCQTFNSACFHGTCICQVHYRIQSTYECVSAFLGQTCLEDAHCDIENAECRNMKCVCRPGYVNGDVITCSPLLGQQCDKASDCVVKNSVCFSAICQCAEFFTPKSDDKCLPRLLSQKCLADTQCNGLSFCNSNIEACVCEPNYAARNGTECVPLLYGRCEDSSQCVVENSHCEDSRCKCNPDFVAFGKSDCRPGRLGQACQRDFDCIELENAKCSNGTCLCRENFVPVTPTRCAVPLGKFCWEDVDCYAENSLCLDNKCQCKSHYRPNSNLSCNIVILGRSCMENDNCKAIPNSICSENVCICRVNNFVVDGMFCVPVLGRTCLTDNDCSGETFSCLNGKCQCRATFTAISVNQCVKTNWLYSCLDNTECSDLWHSSCSKGKCICKPNNVAHGNTMCLPILGGYCWRDDQCQADNSICDDYQCRCRPHFVQVANNFCAPIIP